MSANNRNRQGASKKTKNPLRGMQKTVVTLGDLISAAYEVSGSADAAAKLLSPLSPLSRMLGRRIVVA
jgi:hypothetical protein